MSQQPQDSPLKANLHSQQSNIQARHEHAVSNRAIQPRNMDRYIDHVKNHLEARLGKGKGLRRAPAWANVVVAANVVQAHAALVAVVNSTAETEHYGPTTRLLNNISKAVYTALNCNEKLDTAFVFASGPHTCPSGDFLGTLFEPDYISYRGNIADLDNALTVADYRQPMAWPEIDSVGEQKVPTNRDDGMGQLKSYLATLKRYRPDIPTVRGFKVHAGQVMLAELNACAMWTSHAVSCDSLEPWVAYVVGLYLSLDSRDGKLQYNATQNHFVQWDVMAGKARKRVKYAIAPFYVARAPGRVTFASFQISDRAVNSDLAAEAFFFHDVKGFWKVSWQQVNARSNEKALLRSLHKDGWLPGLVRLRDDDDLGEPLVVPTVDDIYSAIVTESSAEVDDPSTTQSASSTTDTIPVVDRAQDIVRLASIGQPLSQCGSLRELLYTFYDLLETHIHMWREDDEDEGVLHRDISWFNVLYNPRHLDIPGDQRKVLERPCITEIMHKLSGSLRQDDVDLDGCADEATGDLGLGAPTFSPRVLLTDLDHAISKKLLKENPNVGREKTGTPMFMSVELSDPTALSYEPYLPLEKAFYALSAIEESLEGRLALRHAFPNGDKDFMANFQTVMAMEKTRRIPLRLTSRPRHRPRHDAESSFWVFLWAAVRALPLDATEVNDGDAKKFSRFCDIMLKHVVSERETDDRNAFIEYRGLLRPLFHPALAAVGELFENMAFYLSIPWHHYELLNKVDDNHAHVAFRRMLLHFVLTTDAEVLDIVFNTSQPRAVELKPEDDKERKKSMSISSLSHICSSKRKSALSSLVASSTGKKRKAEDPADHCTGASKKAAMRRAAPPQDAPFMTPGAPDHGGPPPDYGAMAREEYDPVAHANRWTAHALRLMFWKDRQLWFSKGK